jgi:hypothetical protein
MSELELRRLIRLSQHEVGFGKGVDIEVDASVLQHRQDAVTALDLVEAVQVRQVRLVLIAAHPRQAVIAREGRGVLLYLRQEGRGIGLMNKIRAYELQDGGADTVEANERLGFAADQRDYGICLPMLEHLGVKSLRLMTNNPRKVKALTDMGITVAERVPLHTGQNPHNKLYLATKASKLDHMMGNEHQGEVDRA